ncbi:hypothetical protein C8R47DRAFT_640362 [Mycena vitilis]|nr:hypothetical protein C8R47DRAFT_640362 [Mycena vitilis]
MASSSSSESYSREAESASAASSSAAPLMPPPGAGPSQPSHLRPFASTSTHSRASSQMLSWVAPEDLDAFDPFAPAHSPPSNSHAHSHSHVPSAFPTIAGHDPLFDAPIPRPGASHSRNVSLSSLGRWTRFKWVVFGFNVVYTVLALGALITILLIHLSILPHSAVIHTAHRTELLLSTLAASIALLAATLGWAGVMLNNRGMLAVYCLLLWVGFGVLVVPGYITYRRFALNLPAKLNAFWSQALDIDGRRAIQDALGCCGYPSPFVEASISARCYARSGLPGCKGPFLRFETKVLQRWYIAVFSLAGVNIGVIIASLLSANHVTYRFGKGMMPERYRLDEAAVRVVLENYAAQLAEEYGPEVAAAFVEHSEAQSRAASRAGSVMGDGLVTPASYSRFPTHQRSYSSFGTSGLPSPTHGHSRSYSSMGMGSPMGRDRRESEADMGMMPMGATVGGRKRKRRETRRHKQGTAYDRQPFSLKERAQILPESRDGVRCWALLDDISRTRVPSQSTPAAPLLPILRPFTLQYLHIA